MAFRALSLSEWLSKCVGVRGLVSRREYLVAGLLLFVAKYLMEAIALRLSAQVWLDPIHFVLPYFAGPIRFAGQVDSALAYGLAFASLPFLWIGTSMSVRRAADAGLRAWIGFLFMVPVVHYLVLLLLVMWPSASGAIGTTSLGAYRAPAPHHLRQASVLDGARGHLVLRSALFSAAAGQVVLHLLVRLFGYEGRWIFLAAPVVMGTTASASYYYAERAVLKGTLPSVPWQPRSNTFWVPAVVLSCLAVGGGFAMYQGLKGAGPLLQFAVPAMFVSILAAALGVASERPADTASSIEASNASSVDRTPMECRPSVSASRTKESGAEPSAADIVLYGETRAREIASRSMSAEGTRVLGMFLLWLLVCVAIFAAFIVFLGSFRFG